MARTRRSIESGSGHAAEERAVRALRRATTGLEGGRLDPARRLGLLDAAGKHRRPSFLGMPAWGLAAAAAAALALAALPALVPEAPAPAGPGATVPAARAAEELQVRQVDGRVELRWQASPDRPYRVTRATDPRLRGRVDQVIQGDRWTDDHENGSPVVYYRVEELEG